MRPLLVALVDIAYLVSVVYLLTLVHPHIGDRPDQPDRPDSSPIGAHPAELERACDIVERINNEGSRSLPHQGGT